MITFVFPATERVAEFEGPQKVVGFFEVRTASIDFVNEIFNADDVVLFQRFRDDVVVTQSNSLLVNLTVSTFVDQARDSLKSGGTIGNVRFNTTEHGHCCVVDTEEDAVVELTKTEELENFLCFGVHSHDTSDAHDEDDLGFRFNVEVTVVLSLTLHADCRTLGISVFFDVFFGTLELFSADTFLGLVGFGFGGIASGFDLFESLALFEKRFWGGNRTV